MEKKVIEITYRSIFRVVVVVLALFFVYFIKDILLLIFLAFFLSALIEPFVNLLEDKKVPRGLGVIIIYFGLIFIIGLLLWVIVPPISQQLSLLISSFPELWEKFSDNFAEIKNLSNQLGLAPNFQQGFSSLQVQLGRAATGFYAFVVSFFRDIVNFIFVLVLTFYLVIEKDAVDKVFRAIVPIKYLPRWVKVYDEIKKKIGDWARGEMILGGIIGTLAFCGLIILVPKYALVLALIAGLTEMIPYLGPILGAIPGVFLGFMVPTVSITRGLAVLAMYVIIQQLENNVIVPQVMKRQVGLNPVIIIVAMLIGARIFGIIGIILAIPVSTAISLIAREIGQRSSLPEE